MGSDSHRCPVTGCPRNVPAYQLMCRGHWGLVPGDVASELYRAWRRGDGAGTARHQAAMRAAIAAVEQALSSGGAS